MHLMASPTTNPYAKVLEGKPPIEVISQTGLTLQSLVAKSNAAQLTKQPAPGKWSVREILCHLADCEIVFAFRLRQTVAEDNHIIQPFDQDKWAPSYTKLSAEDALRTFTTV